MKIQTRFIIQLRHSKKYIKAVGETGFATTTYKRATRFESASDANKFRNEAGIYYEWSELIEIHEDSSK